ncbi:MAG: PIG-L family deacetylase [Clostridia bacterium]|nr:PIG-L family deacetylase [Clostridia bacterium]
MIIKAVIIIILSILFLLVLITAALRSYINDSKIAIKRIRKTSEKYMAVLAHPDDEVMIAGTIAKLKAYGHHVHLLYLTHGEDGPTGGLCLQEELGKLREKELNHVKEILRADSLTILDYPDRYLISQDKEEIKKAISEKMEMINPDYVITFDDTIGLYGHSDHKTCGEMVQALVKEKKFNIRNLYIMTLPESMIKIALKMSKTFKDNYKNSKGLPECDFCIEISRYGHAKLGVIRAHETQWQVMGDVQPLYNKIPYFIYYRIFNREYFSNIRIK